MYPAKDIALPKPMEAILRECRMVRNLVVEIELAEPAVGKVQRHFLTQPAKVDSPMQRMIHHEDAETVFG